VRLKYIATLCLFVGVFSVVLSATGAISNQKAYAACEGLSGKALQLCVAQQTANNSNNASDNVYCNNSDYGGNVADAYQNNACFPKVLEYLYNSAPDRKLSTADFQQKISECLGGNAGGRDGQNVGTCANAVVTCYRKMIDTSSCNANNLADIAMFCNEGRSTTSGEDCGRINTENKAKFDQLKKDAQDRAIADGACTLSNPNSPVAVQNDQNNCKKAALGTCKPPKDYRMTSGAQYNESGFGDYQKCLNNALYSSAKNEQECTARGGSWVGGTDGAQAPRCAGPTPTNPCEGHGGVDQKDSTKCNDGTTNQDSDVAEGVNGNIVGPPSTCGAARTNLIACKGKGEQALGDVLKIIISVLTVIIGIAATGGLAWAAILYAKAEDNAGNVSEAKTLIRNIVIGILLYGFMVAIVNWLVPGGVIG